MNESDFYKLTIGQKIWWKGEEAVIKKLSLVSGCSHEIAFNNVNIDINWLAICADCSLEPPKEKKRYWQWKISGDNNRWYRTIEYTSEDGYFTDRTIYSVNWHKYNKIKIEDDWIEV